MPRRLSRRRAKKFLNETGQSRELIEELVENALRAGRRNAGLEVDDKVNKAVARAYTHRLISGSPGNGADLDFRYLEEGDLEDILRTLRETDLPEEELDWIAETLAPGVKKNQPVKADDGNPDRLKHRLPLDTSASVKYAVNGQERTLTLRDLFETNAEDLHFDYTRWAGGEVGLNKVGLSSQKMKEIIRAAERESQDFDFDPTRFDKKQVTDLKWMFDRTMGRSINDGYDTATVRASRALTGLGFVTRMGSAWYNAVVEAGTIAAMSDIKTMIRSIPALRDALKSIRNGTAEPEMMRQLSMLNGGLSDTMLRQVWGSRHEASQSVLEHANYHSRFDRALATAEDTIEGLKYGAAHLNLLGHTTDFTRKVASSVGMDLLDQIAIGAKKAPGWWGDRARSWGIGDEELKILGDYLKSDAVSRGKLGELTDLGKPPLEVQDLLRTFLYRYTGEAIQHVEQGALPRWMVKHPLMRVVTQFRSFVTASWTKHFLKDAHMGDAVAAKKFAYTAGMAALVYQGRTYLDWYGTDEYEERASADKTIAAAVNYSVNAALMPAIIDTVADMSGNNPPFAQARTSGLAQSLIASDLGSIPAGKYAADAKTLSQYALGDVPRGDLQPTKAQLRAASNIAMIQSLWFLRPLTNRAIEQFGTDEKRSKGDLWEATGLKE
jgi:hypothetical protein